MAERAARRNDSRTGFFPAQSLSAPFGRTPALHRKWLLPPPPLSPGCIAPTLLDEAFFDAIDAHVSSEEYGIYDKYTHTIAITAEDGALVRQYAPHTRVVVIPITYDIPSFENTYAGNALLATGPNPFNVQGSCILLCASCRVCGRERRSSA